MNSKDIKEAANNTKTAVTSSNNLPVKVVAFDLDGTLISNDSAQDWLDFLKDHNVVGAAQAIELCKRHIEAYYRAELDMESYMKDWSLPIVGKSYQMVDRLLEQYVQEVVMPNVFKAGRDLILDLRNKGATVVLISATPKFIVNKVAQLFGVEHSIGVEISMSTNDEFQNNVIPPYSYQSGKTVCLHNWMIKEFGKIVPLYAAYSDSVNDVSLLSLAQHAYCVNPDNALKTIMNVAKWQHIEWRHN